MIATYTFDSMSIELAVLLPEDYPLGRVEVWRQPRAAVRTSNALQVTCSKQIGMSQKTLWKKWMLQLLTFINSQVLRMSCCNVC